MPTTQARIHPLTTSWHWKERDTALPSVSSELDFAGQQWSPAKTFPSEIHAELLKVGRIPDPFVGFNEHRVQWVGEREWLYYTTFDYAGAKDANAELVFEGLDTICDVYLNGTRILSADNMFRTYTVPLDPARLKDSGNTLLLHFQSAARVAKALEARYGRVRAGSANLGDPSRVYVRKAQYGWRWDWGPELMTCGPYRPISLITYTTRLAALHTRAHVSPFPALSPSLKLDLTLSGSTASVSAVRVILTDFATGEPIKEETVTLGELADAERRDVVQWDLAGLVHLWWPVAYGSQTLYTVEAALLAVDGTVLDVRVQRVGFRRVELVQEPLAVADRYGKGTTFLFEVNGVRIFMGGSNWVPAHSIQTELTPEKYRAWLTLMRDGNQNMVRLWGGGVYEPDVFYDICDELGLLVWQDFQFACGVYPAHDEFVANVKAEAEDNVKRLRHHPAMALFCGNNEDYQQVLQWGGIGELPARLIYESVLPAVVEKLTDPPIPYHRGSPYGGKDWDTADPTVGDVHQWNVWAGAERPWQEYGDMSGRFISEFGIPSMPDLRTVDYWLDGNIQERWAQSKLMAQHNRAGNHERRFAILMNENFRLTGDLETHVYNTQIMQSESVSFAYRMWRREWRGKGKEYTAGALVWQLNDCWPVTSWAIVDFFLRTKPVYYTIARELAPLSVGIFRTVMKNRYNDRPKQFYEFGAFLATEAHIEVWANSALLQPRKVNVVLKSFDLLSDWTHEQTTEAVLLPNQSTELLYIPCPSPPVSESAGPLVTPSYSVVVGARLVDPTSGEVLARYADWPQPYRHTDYSDPGLQIAIDGEKIVITVDKPVKALVLSSDDDGKREEVKWSDNALDILPGQPQTVLATGLNGRALKVAYMGKERAMRI
ncbi:Beta-mannosidase B [Sparassis crispa]|uniref:Beta-mannosidase B n=1 Tax=Sparassis crispa TaxID=139825 RepID=A0A401GS87_9APHY|nr:Beta-mannosidase B [Sparassis crispa]GBE85088.1 Beta-mannosidase B [Sparassis crispa]